MAEKTLADRIRERRERREQEKNAPPKISQAEVVFAAWVWQIGVVCIDIATAYIVWQITYLFYGILWLAAGAGGLLWSERQRQRGGNNEVQKEIGELGAKVSIGAVMFMAVRAGVAYVLGYSSLEWVEVVTLILTLALAFYHIFQSRRFHIFDDEFIERTMEARREAEHKRDVREIERAKREAQKEGELLDEENKARGKHGEAFDAAYRKPQQPRRPQDQGNLTPASAAETKTEELAESPNAKGGGRRN